MNVTVDHLGPCKKNIRVEVPVEKVNEVFDGVAESYQKQVQLPGFRPGKAPKHLILRSYEPRIRDEAKKQLIQTTYRDAAQANKLEIIVTLKVEEQEFNRGAAFSYIATCEVAPEFNLPEYKGIKARREISTPSDADVERATNILREQQGKHEDVQRELKEGDTAVVNYSGTSEGKPFTEFNATAVGLTSGQNFWVAIRPGSFIPGFSEQLVGAKAGDKRTVSITLPTEFVFSELAGKPAVFEVEIVGVKERILPAVDQAFAASLGAASVDELMKGIRQDLQNELNLRQKRSVRDQILKTLLSQVEFELPESVVGSETRNIVYNIVDDNQRRGVPRDLIEKNKAEILQNASTSAKDRVKAGFILNRIAAAEKITTTREDLVRRVTDLAAQQNVPVEKLAKTIQERNGFNEIAQEILTSKVLDFLEVNASIEEVPVTRS